LRSSNGFQSGSTSEGNNLSCLSVVPVACVSDEGSVTQHSPSLQNLVSGRVEKHSPCISSQENSVRGSVKLHSPSVQVPSRVDVELERLFAILKEDELPLPSS